MLFQISLKQHTLETTCPILPYL